MALTSPLPLITNVLLTYSTKLIWLLLPMTMSLGMAIWVSMTTVNLSLGAELWPLLTSLMLLSKTYSPSANWYCLTNGPEPEC